MAIAKLLSKQSAENGILAKFNKDYRFSIRRSRTAEGLSCYYLENTARHECLVIPRELFDHFRSLLSKILEDAQQNKNAETQHEIEEKLFFHDQDYYSFRSSHVSPELFIVKELVKQRNSTGMLSLSVDCLETLIELLYHPKLRHPNDIFDRIIRYHKLFQFSFTEGSESITSGLALRKDVLSHIDEFIPSLGNRVDNPNLIRIEMDTQDFTAKVSEKGAADSKKAAFKSKLGQKGDQQGYTVDYDELFKSRSRDTVPKAPKAADDSTKRGATLNATNFPLPLLASDIKAYVKPPFRCELSKEEVSILRENFLQDRESDLYLGFEIIDAIYRSSGKLKTYRFPLYYLKVSIEESGRFIFIHPPKSGDLFMNHLALATMVETFSPSKTGEPVEKFFANLLSQKIEVDNNLSGIRILRSLPFKEDVFDRTREVLLGLPDENGKGGILTNLKLIGIECDLESVALYKSAKIASPITRALDSDLERIQEIAYENPKKFYSSLLGQFLTPDIKLDPKKEEAPFFDRPFNPGALPKSSRKLFDRLNEHDVVLLEGPPGTGKTFTIMNLFLHCVNTQKRLLIVSDQMAAIHALTEKLLEYLVGKDFDSPHHRGLIALFNNAVKVVDEIPSTSPDIKTWMNHLSKMLKMDSSVEFDLEELNPKLVDDVAAIDDQLTSLQTELATIMEAQLEDRQGKRRVAPKYAHPTTIEDIEDLITLLEFIGAGQHTSRNQPSYYKTNQILLQTFLSDRKYIIRNEDIGSCYEEFSLEFNSPTDRIQELENLYLLIDDLIKSKPRSHAEFSTIMAERTDSPLIDLIYSNWEENFEQTKSKPKKVIRTIRTMISHPSMKQWQRLSQMVRNQIKLIQSVLDFGHADRILRQFNTIHQALHSKNKKDSSLALEIIRYSQGGERESEATIQIIMEKLKTLQKKRDRLMRERYLQCLGKIAGDSIASDPKKGTNAVTSLANLIEALKDTASIDHGHGVALLKEFQDKLYESFPIWICRKQAVSFLFPSKEQLFDLVIVDEAGQCRVDDAIPLLYRAKKIMVVGDEKQTVLDKNSVIDDYLFKEFNLEQHLQRTQARGIKGGGSNIFGLVKAIKQAGVMLDEHYRCPPEIIRYSNEYVYNGDLKVMQWQHPSSPPSVFVDYSEKKAKSNKKPTSGKYKGIETEVIDRFLTFISKTIGKIEKETGKTISMDTDVAICYFLLKNEPYIRDKKGPFLQKLNRGSQVLDGAGAALQGKERDYIFYLWDVNRANMKSFRQGDDPDKRKGELNVLMSRPKKRAFHYLHPDFETLKHDTATITDYLWKAYNRQSQKSAETERIPRVQRPSPQFRPWQRFSGELMHRILLRVWSQRQNPGMDRLESAVYSVEVGDPRHKVDLILLDPDGLKPSLGIVDLSAFEGEKNPEQEIIDYFFQLRRAQPPIDPIFVFLHELADERSQSFRILEEKIMGWLNHS